MSEERRKGRLLLVDGHGLAFRGFYALPEMNAPDGTPTNAILGFFNMLLKAVDEWQPDAVGLYFDPKGPTRRDEMYDQYKEGRSPTPDAFKVQLPLIQELAAALGFRIEIRPGFEADDAIAACAIAAAEAGWEAIILSADKDMMQLLRPGLKLVRPGTGVSDTKVYDHESFAAEYGFAPSAMTDYLALVGDSVDNIPGVKGIGDKTARTLLAAHGSLDGIYAALDSLKGAVKAKLENGREMAYWSRSLVVPIAVDCVAAEELHRSGIDYEKANLLLAKLGLKNLSKRIGAAPAEGTARAEAMTEPRAEAVAEPEATSESKSEAKTSSAMRNVPIAELFSLPTLILGDDPPGLASFDGRCAELGAEDRTQFFAWLQEHRVILAGYKKWIRHDGRFAEHPAAVLDVEMAHYFFHPDGRTHELADISPTAYAGGKSQLMAIRELWATFAGHELAPQMLRVLTEIDSPLTPSLLRLQDHGIKADVEELRELDLELKAEMRLIEREIFSFSDGPINLNSPKQVGALLFEQLNLPVIKRTKTGYSTDVSVLEELSRLPEPDGKIPAKLLEYRGCAKMSSGFVQPFIVHALDSGDRTIHSTFLHTVTGTGRLASRDPNVQNMPVFGRWADRFRGTLHPRAGMVFVAADYSQIELRVLAHLSGEERLLESFAQDLDIHRQTASWVYNQAPEEITPEQRRFAKTVNFGLLYGMSANTLAMRMGVDRKQAVKLVDRYFSVLPKIKDYIERSASEARERGYTISAFGRIRPLSEVATVEGRDSGSLKRVAVNTPIQSTAADIAKIALFRFDELLRSHGEEANLVLQVHDSLVCEVPIAEADRIEKQLIITMEEVKAIDVPLKAEPKRGASLAEV